LVTGGASEPLDAAAGHV
jgi:hypothetical protein